MSLCIGLGCGVAVPPGVLSCEGHHGLEPAPPLCPDGHGELEFVLVSAVRLGGVLSLLWRCPAVEPRLLADGLVLIPCDYVTSTDYPPPSPPPSPKPSL